MSERTVTSKYIQCDRCSAEAKNGVDPEGRFYGHLSCSNEGPSTDPLDVCPSCLDDFKIWMTRKKEGTPCEVTDLGDKHLARIFQGQETQQVDRVTGAKPNGFEWFVEPAGYADSVTWSKPMSSLCDAVKKALAEGFTRAVIQGKVIKLV